MSESLQTPESLMSITIDFPLGTLAAASVPTQRNEARVTQWGSVVQQMSGGEDEISITFENTKKDGTGKRVSDFWDFDNPPEGSTVKIWDENDGAVDRIFWGTVSEIEAVTEGFVTVRVRSLDHKLDQICGDPITLDDYPDCPDENVGRRKPRIYGTISRFKPPLVDDNAATKLDAAITDSDTTISVEDVSDFDDTGRIQINDEYIDYTGRNTTTNDFTGCTRGAGGTDAESHVSGTDVYEVADLVYLVDEGPDSISTIDGIKIVNSDGIAIPAPSAWYTVDTSGPSTITFDRVPTVPVATEGSTFKAIDADADVSSTAQNPLYACGGETGGNWTEFNYATINVANPGLFIKKSTDVSHPNSVIKRAWLVVEHYVDPTASASDLDVYIDSDLQGTLTTNSNTPKDVQEDDSIHKESKGFHDSHAHTISGSNHGHDVETGQQETPHFITASQVYLGKADCLIDRGFGIFAQMYTTTSDYANVKYLSVPNVDATIRYVRLFCSHGQTVETCGGALSFYIKGTLEASHSWSSSSSSKTTTYSSKIAPGSTRTMGDLLDATSYYRVTPNGSAGKYFCPNELWVEFFITNPSDNTDIGNADSATPLETSAFTWFPVTPTGASEEDKWQWFKDKVIKVQDGGLTGNQYCYVLRAWFEVEFVDSTTEPSKNVICNVEGHYAAGNGGYILYDMANKVVGLALSRFDTDAWTQVISDTSSGYGGALLDFESGRDLLNRVGEQFSVSFHWENGLLKPLYKPLIANLSDPVRSIDVNDIYKGTFTVSRLPLSEIYNKIRLNYKQDFVNGGTRKTLVEESSASQTLYGKTQEYEINAEFVIDDADADALAAQLLDYKAWGVDIIECSLTRDYIDLKRGDLVRLGHRVGSWQVVEILETEIIPRSRGMPTQVRIVGIERRTG